MKKIASELVENLARLQNGVTTTPILQQSDCVIFQDGKAYTFSGDVFAIVDCDLGITGAVNYRSLMDVLKKYGDAEVDIEHSSIATLVIKRGRSHTKLPFEETILLSLKAVPTPDSAAWLIMPAEFDQAVALCESVAKHTRADDVLSSINITPTFLEAASTAQLIRYNLTLHIPHRFLVRSGVLRRIVSSANIDEYQVVNRWLFLRHSPSTVFAIPLYMDEFIAGMDSYLQPAADAITFPGELKDEMPLVSAVLGKDELLEVQLSGGKCTLVANGVRGSHTSEVDMITPIGLTFKISPEMFSRVVSEFPDCTISANGIKVNNAAFSYAASVE